MTRRELLAAALATPALWAKHHFDRSRLSAITDEIGKTPEESLAFAREYGLQWIELRSVPPKGREYIYLDDSFNKNIKTHICFWVFYAPVILKKSLTALTTRKAMQNKLRRESAEGRVKRLTASFVGRCQTIAEASADRATGI